MSELRRDPITGRWVIVATERAKRPENFSTKQMENKPERVASCPFCAGNEHETPPESFALGPDTRKPNAPDWTVRVVPNKFPALVNDGEQGISDNGLYQSMPGIGIHEVIIETPNHDLSPGNLSEESVEDLIRVYRERFIQDRKHPGIKHVLIFRNHGREAGASLEHPHSQIIAGPIVPPVIAEEFDGARSYYELNERCVFCDIIAREINSGQRLVLDTERFIVMEPYASRVPFETWMLPKKHNASFEQMMSVDIPMLAKALKSTLSAISKGLGDPPYNYFIHSAPITDDASPFYHWHVEIIPKLTIAAGFEVGAGVYINITRPEDTAIFLRNALPSVL